MTVAEALTVQAGLQKLDDTIFVASVAWYEPLGVNECNDTGTRFLKRIHIVHGNRTDTRCSYCGKGPSMGATLERPDDL